MTRIAQQTEALGQPFILQTDKQSALDSLCYYKKIIADIKKKDSIIAVYTNGKLMLIDRLQKLDTFVEQSYKKIAKANPIDSTFGSYKKAIATNDLVLIVPNVFNLPTIDIGFRLNSRRLSPKSTYIQVKTQDSTIYEQSFSYSSNTNCFMLPNRPEEGIEITIGVFVIEKKDTILYYTKYKTNVQR